MKLILLIFMASLFGGAAFGQCARESVEADALRGQVFDVYGNGKIKEVVADAEVNLKRQTRKGQISIIRIKTDSAGMFSARKVSPGIYFLYVSSPYFSQIVVQFKLKKPSRGVNLDTLLIRLDVPGPALDACVGYIEVKH